jgi:hypothetical protein
VISSKAAEEAMLAQETSTPRPPYQDGVLEGGGDEDSSVMSARAERRSAPWRWASPSRLA